MRGKRWSKNEKFKAIQLQAMGYSNGEIAEMFKTSYSSLSMIIYRTRLNKYYAVRNASKTS